MRIALLGAAGAVALSALAFTAPAQAQCWFDGWSTRCAATPAPYAAPYYGYPASPYAAWNSFDYRDYRYAPYWLPSAPGPRAGGH